jgi:hypothetical protein
MLGPVPCQIEEILLPNLALSRRGWIVGIATAFFALGCSHDTTSPSVELLRDAPGTWVAPFSVPGSGEGWTLSLSGTDITGDGTWSGEACCSGTVSITGTVRGDSLHLDVVYRQTNPPTAIIGPRFVQIDAVLDTPTDLVGIGTNADRSTYPVHYIKSTR